MRLKLLAVVAAGLMLAADKPKQNDAKTDLAEMQGAWKAVGGEAEGQAVPDELVKTVELIVKGDHYTYKMQGQEAETGTFKLDPSAKPKHIDVMIATGPDKGKSQLGIYDLAGDIFKAAIAQPGAPRPTGFTTKKGDQVSVTVLKRQK